MSINVNDNIKGIVRVVSDLVGNQLSEYKNSPTTTAPSVFRNRQKPPRPSFPYASVDFIGSSDYGYSSKSKYLDANKDLVSKFDYKLTLFIDIHSDTENDGHKIAIDLRNKLFSDYGRNRIIEFTQGRLLNVSSPSFNPNLMQTDYEEVSRIILDLSVRDTVIDSTVGNITEVFVDGELFEDYDQNYPPLDFNINAP